MDNKVNFSEIIEEVMRTGKKRTLTRSEYIEMHRQLRESASLPEKQPLFNEREIWVQ